MEALWKGDAVALAERLEEGGVVDWGARRDGCLPLHLAVFRGHTAVAALLLGVGADVNRADDYVFGAMTPLHEAACYGRADIVPLLVKANADVNQPDRGGWLPLHYAVMYECQPGRPGHLRLNVAAQLLAAGSDVNQASNIGLTPLAAAARHGCFGAVQILCSYGAARNGTEIEQATVNRHPKVAAWLTATADCITPLHYPSIIPPERACRLLRAGADLHAAREQGGRTPLSLARELDDNADAPQGSTAWLVLRAAELGSEVVSGPWSPRNHLFWPAASRARAAELLPLWKWTVGEGEEEKTLPLGLWVECVMPHAVE